MSTRIFTLLICTWLASSCNSEPRTVFVPETESSSTLSIGVSSARASLSENILLSASRKNYGAWIEVPRTSLSPDACWMVQPPDSFEEQVAGNVRWVLSPPEHGEFNLVLREDGKRSLVISKPGTYSLTATSSVWCGESVASENLIVLKISAD